jgi:hypothetical protein
MVARACLPGGSSSSSREQKLLQVPEVKACMQDSCPGMFARLQQQQQQQVPA